MLIKFMLLPIWLLFVVLQTLYWTYFWQLKEYRYDRLYSAVNEQGWRAFVPIRLYRPVWTKKALLIVLLSALSTSLLVFVTPFLWFFTPFIVALWVLTFNIPTYFYSLHIGNKALQKIESIKKANPQFKVIAITGSYGKTSTKDLIAKVLSSEYNVVKTPKNNNTFIGVSRTIISLLTNDTDFFIVEAGAYKQGEIKKIANLVKPNIGILTGLTYQHLALFGSTENLIKAKFELVDSISEKGLVFMNGEDALLKEQAKKVEKKIVWYKGSTTYQLSNIACMAAVAKLFNIKASNIAKVAASAKGEYLHLPVVINKQGLTIINDSYSSNPVGFERALKELAERTEKNKIIITSGIIELSSKSRIIHEQLGKKASQIADLVIITKPHFAKYFGGKCITNPKTIIAQVSKYPLKDTVVLLEGRLNAWLIQSLHN